MQESADSRWHWMARSADLKLLLLLVVLVAPCVAAPPRGENLGGSGAMLRQRKLVSSQLQESTLENSQLEESTLETSQLEESMLENSQLEESTLENSAQGRVGTGKVAFLFLTRRDIPLQPLWERFLSQSNGRASVHVHVADPGFNLSANVDPSSVFYGTQIGRIAVRWGGFGMVHAEKALFRAALQDPSVQRFVLLSESCIPLRPFDFVYSYLNAGNKSFITSHNSTWRLGGKRFQSEIPLHHARKGSQWIALTRAHADMLVNEDHYIKLFMEDRAWIPDETYVQTVVPFLDPDGVEPRGVTFVQWQGSDFEWKSPPPPSQEADDALLSSTDRTPPLMKDGARHPRVFFSEEVTPELIRELQTASMTQGESISKTEFSTSQPCQLAGKPAPCYLFARKFPPETLQNLLTLQDVLGY